MTVGLYFNRSFLVSERPDSSWTRAMRPDCSILVRSADALGDVSPEELSIWLHFDAKYRVEHIREQFSPGVAAADAEETERVSQSKREDLLKMHAYRDAIRRSAGAYVLYPGSGDGVSYSEHDEILPGLGAFSLRPAPGRAAGIGQLEAFLRQVIDHAADRATQHERSRYWSAVIHQTSALGVVSERTVPPLRAPPRDVPVLCGYVRNTDHRSWIEKTGLYNLRAGNRRGAVTTDATALQPTDLVLYGPETTPQLWRRSGAWFVQGRSELRALGYPEPGGETYLVCSVEPADPQPGWMASVEVAALVTDSGLRGAPSVVTWDQLLGC
jgi:hypothetical protein